jgi:hypothetical protein
MAMSEEQDKKPTRSRIGACRFVEVDDADERNDILFKDPQTIDEWKQSLERCMTIVEERMDDIERRIISGEMKDDKKDKPSE